MRSMSDACTVYVTNNSESAVASHTTKMGNVKNKQLASHTTKMSDMSVLPTEVMLRIFHMLGNQDLSKVVLVCRRWRDIAEDPSLWTWGRIRVRSAYDVQMLGIKRLQGVQKIWVVWGAWESQELDKLFQIVRRLRNLSNLYMPHISLSSLDPELLVTAVNKVEELYMYNCQMTSNQAIAMFEGLSDTTKLKTLNVHGNNLSTVNKDTLATVINKLETVYMYNTQLKGEQVTCLLSQASRQTKLNILQLGYGVARHVDQQIVQQATQNIGDVS